MPELEGQLREGTPLDERACIREAIGHARKLHEAFSAFADRRSNYKTAAQATSHLRGLRDCMRGIALLRNDMHWLKPVRVLDAVDSEIQKEFGDRARLAQLAMVMGGGQVPMLSDPKKWKLRADVVAKMAWLIDDLFTRRQGPKLDDLPGRTPPGTIH